jgi:hypothetical protein
MKLHRGRILNVKEGEKSFTELYYLKHSENASL